MLSRKIPWNVIYLAIPISLSLLIAFIDVKFYKLTPIPRATMIRSQLFLIFYIAFTFGIWISYKSLKYILTQLFPTWMTTVLLGIYSILFLLSYISFPLGLLLANYKSVLICKISFLSLGHLVIISVFFTIEVFFVNKFLKSRKLAISISIYIIAVILTIDGAIRAYSEPSINHVNLKLNNFPKSLNGLTLVHISDIHIGPIIGRDEVNEMVEQVNVLQPDVIIISGDLTDLSVARGGMAMDPLGKLKSKYGTYFATGNHDYYILDMNTLIEKLKSLGIIPLLNERVQVPGNEENDWFYIAGLEDISTRALGDKNHLIDIHRALGGRDKDHATVLIAHQPNAMREAVEWKVELILGGHTHGGQFFPLNIVIYFFNPFFAGLYTPVPNTYVYVNTGTFFYMIPLKHIFRREICVFHLYPV
ncbi:Transmembrane protein with metallophosphoesterase domain [Oopsacas minuta]|uniref:Transmembrane protein with metallophosphoesterase domain n=1 Tax=Oopsacas minuta TaxID=111878 RepID=A0AAV7KL76_9METZ|nr:Transmembrane protein with metallophosphoesterase domain [Oopsacas minuta]